MSERPSPTIKHRIEYLIYRGFEAGLRMMSLETTFRLGEMIGRIAHWAIPSRREQVTRNLRFAYGAEKSPEEIASLTAEVFERCGANLLSSLRIPFLSDGQILEHLSLVGLDELVSEAGKGGLVLVSPHMGNWELLAQVIFLIEGEIEVGTHYRPLNNTLMNALVERRRKRRGLRLFAKRASAHKLAAFVREGGALAILADQRVGSRGAAATFFGRPTTVSPLPHLIAKRGEGQLLSLICQTVDVAKWEVSFLHVPEFTAQACADGLELAWRSSPSDVFWFEDRWRIQGRDPLSFLAKYPAEQEIPRPLRLVNLSDQGEPLDYPAKLLHQETCDFDFSQNDALARDALQKISRSGFSPVDVFTCPPEEVARIRKLSGKVLVIPTTTH